MSLPGRWAPRPLSQHLAGAPISWGVCEVPGWGFQLDPHTVLDQMRQLGIAATEFDPDGFVEDDPTAKAEQLSRDGLAAVGEFLPVSLHDPTHDPLREADEFIDACLAAAAGRVVLAASAGVEGYDGQPVLDEAGWNVLLNNLDRIRDHAAGRGVVTCLHPHVGTASVTCAGRLTREQPGWPTVACHAVHLECREGRPSDPVSRKATGVVAP